MTGIEIVNQLVADGHFVSAQPVADIFVVVDLGGGSFYVKDTYAKGFIDGPSKDAAAMQARASHLNRILWESAS